MKNSFFLSTKITARTFRVVIFYVFIFSLSGCARGFLLPNIDSGHGVAITQISEKNTEIFSYYTDVCQDDCIRLERLNFETFSNYSYNRIEVIFSMLDFYGVTKEFKLKSALIAEKHSGAIKLLSSKYTYIYEETAFPIVVKYHFIPSNILMKDIVFKEKHKGKAVIHYFHVISNSDIEPDNSKNDFDKHLVEFDLSRRAFTVIAHEISHVAQKYRHTLDNSFPNDLKNDEARAKMFEFAYLVFLAQKLYDESGINTNIAFEVSKEELLRQSSLETSSNSKVNIDVINGTNLKTTKISSHPNRLGYFIGAKKIISLLRGGAINSKEKQRIRELAETIREDFRNPFNLSKILEGIEN